MSPGLLATLTVVGFALFALALYALTNRFGPVRGFLYQPAARFRAPGSRLATAMYVVAVVHVIAGIVAFVVARDPGLPWGVLLAALLIAGFYAMLGSTATLAAKRERALARRARAD